MNPFKFNNSSATLWTSITRLSDCVKRYISILLFVEVILMTAFLWMEQSDRSFVVLQEVREQQHRVFCLWEKLNKNQTSFTPPSLQHSPSFPLTSKCHLDISSETEGLSVSQVCGIKTRHETLLCRLRSFKNHKLLALTYFYECFKHQ